MSAEMVAVKISRLEGKALDYATAQAAGEEYSRICSDYGDVNSVYTELFEPSTDWAVCGPLIIELRMTFATFGTGPIINGKEHIYPIIAIPGIRGKYHASEGSTHLIAACRCYVLAKMSMDADGEVMVPVSLVTQ
jgi:hypothetical protein